MKATTACQCIVALSLISTGVQTQGPATAAVESGADTSASSGTSGARKPGTVNRDATMRGTTPPAKPKQAPMPPDPAQQVEERVRSGQMDQPIAQGAISERLNQLESGSKSPFENTVSGQR